MNDLFLLVTHSHLSNYADDNTLHCFSEWFNVDYMVSVLNADKCPYMCLDKATENTKISFDGNTYVNSKEEKILGIIIDNDFFFDSHKGSV